MQQSESWSVCQLTGSCIMEPIDGNMWAAETRNTSEMGNWIKSFSLEVEMLLKRGLEEARLWCDQQRALQRRNENPELRSKWHTFAFTRVHTVASSVYAIGTCCFIMWLLVDLVQSVYSRCIHGIIKKKSPTYINLPSSVVTASVICLWFLSKA